MPWFFKQSLWFQSARCRVGASSVVTRSLSPTNALTRTLRQLLRGQAEVVTVSAAPHLDATVNSARAAKQAHRAS
jgi:hypothetical protein